MTDDEKKSKGQRPVATEGCVEVKRSFTETAQVRYLSAGPITNLRFFIHLHRFVDAPLTLELLDDF